MRKNLVILIAAVLTLVAFGWTVVRTSPLMVPDLAQLRQVADLSAEVLTKAGETVSRTTEAVTKAAQEITLPEPLRAKTESPTAKLTQDGVLLWTNAARRNNGGLKPLTLNTQLNAAAEAKLRDMFAKQYFAHVSPTGIGPSDLAKAADYVYLTVGENLALGNFADDQALVQAWMDSPGHRANILGNYDEIGLAVGRGTYEGRTTWLAVQEFGRPRSACPNPDATLKTKIDADEVRLADVTAQADALRAELESTKRPRTREQVDAYNAKVNEYNALVEQINSLNREIQGEITVYNGQVQAFNACAGG